MKITLIPSDQVKNVWHLASKHLDAAARTVRQRHDDVDIFEECVNGKQLLWLIFEEDSKEVLGALTTSVAEYPQYTALTIPYMGGKGIWKLRDMIMETMLSFARDNGFQTIECYGRDEWIRIGRKYGFEKAFSVFEVEVNRPETDDADIQ